MCFPCDVGFLVFCVHIAKWVVITNGKFWKRLGGLLLNKVLKIEGSISSSNK